MRTHTWFNNPYYELFPAIINIATTCHRCLYFLPKFFAVPAFRPTLEAIFPDPSLTLTYYCEARNDVWEQVKQHDKDLFADADHRVGIQVWSLLMF